jgi:hypothetical protein
LATRRSFGSKKMRPSQQSLLPNHAECEEVRECALLIADVSGFTKLNETFAAKGRAGVEQVSKHLNK